MLPARVTSIFMDNIHPDVITWQRKVVERFLPDNWQFEQFHYRGVDYSHPKALMYCLSQNDLDLNVFLDIDCIPLSEDSFKTLADDATVGALSGAVQRANHINNDSHLYIGPFCMAFSMKQYRKLGSPSFVETSRGDCGEELTYIWSAAEQPVKFLYPNHVSVPMWSLTGGEMFGLGTTYQNLFYHAFAIRQAGVKEQFVSRCVEVLEAVGEKEMVVAPPPSERFKPRKIQAEKSKSENKLKVRPEEEITEEVVLPEVK